jgi:hypothetical protein
MKIRDIITENIFTTDYHKVMNAVAKLYDSHYNINIWENGEAHDEAAKVLLKAHPSQEQLEYIIKTGELPEDLYELDFPINDDIMMGYAAKGDEDLTDDLDGDIEETQASKKLCTSSRSDASLGASNLASCKSQGYRAREGKKSHKIGDKRVTVGDKKIKGKAHGGPLPDWS